MFFKGKKKQEIENNIEEERFLERFRNVDVPILILDERWHVMFSESKKTDAQRTLEKEIKELFKSQAKLSKEIELQEEKKKVFFNNILMHMKLAQISEEEALKQEENQEHIRNINKEIEKLELEFENMPKRIKELNQELLIESLRYCYRRMRENKRVLKEQEELVKEAEKLLEERVSKKQEKEKENEQMYVFMHRLFGRNVLEIFDDFD